MGPRCHLDTHLLSNQPAARVIASENQFPVNLMKCPLLVGICLCAPLVANAELAFKEIRTASKDVLVAYFKSTVINADEVNTTNLTSWTINGQPVTAINKFVT